MIIVYLELYLFGSLFDLLNTFGYLLLLDDYRYLF
jgi:hypothetical protein